MVSASLDQTVRVWDISGKLEGEPCGGGLAAGRVRQKMKNSLAVATFSPRFLGNRRNLAGHLLICSLASGESL